MDKIKVLVLMSTFNGKERIIKQVESIINQENVYTSILIRDDGSQKDTIKILEYLKNKYKKRIDIIYGINIGWKKSFLYLLNKVSLEYDYYAFSDQDDIWMKDKCNSCIDKMNNGEDSEIKMCHCNSISVNEKLEKRKEQEYRKQRPKTLKNALAMECFQGCGMIWNNNAMRVLKNCKITDDNIAHDFWVGIVIFLFGNIYFLDIPKFYHIRYGNNESSDGSVLKGRINRIKKILNSNNPYMNASVDIINNFENELTDDDVEFIKKIINYKTSFNNKISLILDKDFSRDFIFSNILFKTAIFFNKF